MAIKAIVMIDNYVLHDDLTFSVVASLCNNGHFSSGAVPAGPFAADATSIQVNDALKDVAIAYLDDPWEESFNPLLDSIKILNPISVADL